MNDQPDTRIAILGLKTSPTCELSVNDKGPGAIAMLIPQLFLRIDERDALLLTEGVAKKRQCAAGGGAGSSAR